MDIKDVLKLTEMGWTKDEILALSGSAAEEAAPDQEEIPAEQPAPSEPAPLKDERMDIILDKLEKIASGIQINALKGTRIPERESADDALAKIINLQYKKEE